MKTSKRFISNIGVKAIGFWSIKTIIGREVIAVGPPATISGLFFTDMQ